MEEKEKELISIGDLASEVEISVRTLQYYDQIGLLCPSYKRNNLRRFYTREDKIKLYQILALKDLGFSLKDIKAQIEQYNTPSGLVDMLSLQKEKIKAEIAKYEGILIAIEKLEEEIDYSEFSRLKEDIHMLRKFESYYWTIKLYGEKLKEHSIRKFKDNPEAYMASKTTYESLVDEGLRLKKHHISPLSPLGQTFAEAWWQMVNEYVDGDRSMIQSLIEYNNDKSKWDEKQRNKQSELDSFIGEALAYYLENKGVNLKG